MSQFGMLLAASFRTENFEALTDMHPLDRDFLFFWMRQKEYDQMQQWGRLLGVLFSVGEIRNWSKQEGATLGMMDEDNLLVPLSFMLRPESRESIQKMVGKESPTPEGYQKKDGEIIIDLGKVSPEEFKQFVEKNRVMQMKQG